MFHNAGSSHILSVESAGTSSGCSKYTATPPQSVTALITTTAAPTQSTAALTTTPAAQNRATPAACTPVTAAPFTGTLANVSLLWPRSKQLRLAPLLKQLQVKESLLKPNFSTFDQVPADPDVDLLTSSPKKGLKSRWRRNPKLNG